MDKQTLTDTNQHQWKNEQHFYGQTNRKEHTQKSNTKL